MPLATRLLLHVVAAALVACVVAVALFSAFGKNWHAPWDSIMAYANYFHRGSERENIPNRGTTICKFSSPIGRRSGVFWSEGFIAVLAIIGADRFAVCGSRNRKRGPRPCAYS